MVKPATAAQPLLKCNPRLLQLSPRESGVAFTWHCVVTETMNHILREDDSDLQWQPDSSDLPTESSVRGCANLHNTFSNTLLPAVQTVQCSYTCW